MDPIAFPRATRGRRRPGRPAGGAPVIDRDGVLEAAERAIRRAGPAVSLDEIAAEAGVTKPIVYARVGGRGELTAALAERLVDRIIDAMRAAVPPGATGREALRTFVVTHLRTVASDRHVYVYVNGGGDADAGTDRVLDLAGRSAQPVADGLAAMRIAAGLDPAVALPWAYGIVGMLHMTVLWWLREADRSADELADQLTDLLWPALQPPPSSRPA